MNHQPANPPREGAVLSKAALGRAAAGKLGVNDIAYLWPVPEDQQGLTQLLDASSTMDGGGSIIPEVAFKTLLQTAESLVFSGPLGEPHKIAYPEVGTLDLHQRVHWKVVAFRVDPSAPTTHENPLGSIPQIRLILQPVGLLNAKVHAYDYAVHLAFSYVKNAAPPFVPDTEKFQSILDDLAELKMFLAQCQPPISTDGDLRVHPGLAGPAKGFANKVHGFLAKHLARGNFSIAAFMGVDFPKNDTWMFFQPVDEPSRAARLEAVFPNNAAGPVVPLPTNSNVYPDAPNSKEQGVSTAVLFKILTPAKLASPAIAGQSTPQVQDIADIIANPDMTDILNTDCVSCHTESTRRHQWNLKPTTYAYKIPPGIGGVALDIQPTNRWNLRNFGWFTETPLVNAKASASTRMGNEAAHSLVYIRERYQ